MMRELCFATNNAHKLSEVRSILGPDFRIYSLREINCLEELPETQSTFEGNALQKAQYVYDRYELPCIADDSGLEVEALNGAPGVYSARYAGPQRNDDDNIRLLLANLREKGNRQARFRTVIAYLDAAGKALYFDGIVAGEIIRDKRGGQGFGYDPVFVPNGHDRTFAEMSADEKNAVSHRGIAVRGLAAFLKGASG